MHCKKYQNDISCGGDATATAGAVGRIGGGTSPLGRSGGGDDAEAPSPSLVVLPALPVSVVVDDAMARR